MARMFQNLGNTLGQQSDSLKIRTTPVSNDLTTYTLPDSKQPGRNHLLASASHLWTPPSAQERI